MIYKFLSIGDKLTDIIKDAFGVNLTEFLINFIATILLILIVRFFFWNKVTKFLEGKKSHIEKEYKLNNEMKDEATAMKAEAEEILKDSKNKSQEIVSNASKSAEIEKERIISDAKNRANEILNESKEEALRQKEVIINEAKEEVIDIASQMASKMIKENIDQSKYNEKVLEELGEQND